MDGLLTNLEATVRTYELRSYSVEQYDRQGDASLSKTISFWPFFRTTFSWNDPAMTLTQDVNNMVTGQLL